MLKIKIKVFGYVHGVFFRYNTRKIARKLGLTGFVKNLPDGTVYIEAEGPQDKLNELLNFSKRGSKQAQVDKVEYELMPPTNEFKGFDYRF
ncbi:MAG: acylphosphatase [Candidatus Thorarchaeota archaeon]